MKKKTAVYPGSFDPVTFGHLDIIDRASKIFDHLIVSVFVNSAKKPMFSVTERVAMLKAVLKGRKNVSTTFEHPPGRKKKNIDHLQSCLRPIYMQGKFMDASVMFAHKQATAGKSRDMFPLITPNGVLSLCEIRFKVSCFKNSSRRATVTSRKIKTMLNSSPAEFFIRSKFASKYNASVVSFSWRTTSNVLCAIFKSMKASLFIETE